MGKKVILTNTSVCKLVNGSQNQRRTIHSQYSLTWEESTHVCYGWHVSRGVPSSLEPLASAIADLSGFFPWKRVCPVDQMSLILGSIDELAYTCVVSITFVLIILINENKDSALGWCALSLLLFSSSCNRLPVVTYLYVFKWRPEKWGHSDQRKVRMLSQVALWKGYKRQGTNFKCNHLLHLEITGTGNFLPLLKSV